MIVNDTRTPAQRIAHLHPSHPYHGMSEREVLRELHRLAGEVGQYRSLIEHDPEAAEAAMAAIVLPAIERLHREALRLLGKA